MRPSWHRWSTLNAYIDGWCPRYQQDEEPLYWPREWRKVDRPKERRAKKGEWFRGADQKNQTVEFVSATPRGLRRRYIQTIRKAKVTVAEDLGRNVTRRLQESDPFRSKYDDSGKCMVC